MQVVRVDPDAPDRIRSEWKKHFRQIASDHAGVSRIGRAAVEKTLSDVLDRDVDEALDELNRLLSQRSDRTWTEFNRALVVAGFELLLDGGPADEKREPAARKRQAPPIVIESCDRANDFVRRMAGASNVFETFRSEADGLRTLMERDRTGYMQSLVFALVFANAEKWHIATLLARRATSIAGRDRGEETSDASTSSPCPVSGREAFYLCSFAVRLGARTESELREAESLLEEAEAALGREHAGNRCLSVGTARFRAERLALGLERHLLARFVDVSVQSGRALDELFKCLARLHDELEDEKDAWVREHVRRRVLTNAFMIAALIEADRPLPRSVSDFCERRHRNLTAFPAPDDGGVSIPTTRLVSAVTDYAKARFAPLAGAGAKARIYRQVAELQRDIEHEDESRDRHLLRPRQVRFADRSYALGPLVSVVRFDPGRRHYLGRTLGRHPLGLPRPRAHRAAGLPFGHQRPRGPRRRGGRVGEPAPRRASLRRGRHHAPACRSSSSSSPRS